MKIAITGHQVLGSQEVKNWLNKEVELQIEKINVELGYSCLAAGADQLFTQILVEYSIPFVAIIPSLDYEITFEKETLKIYTKLLAAASEIIQLEHKTATERAFFDASKLMVDRCDILFAIWNNQPAKGLGGTADVVSYAKEKGNEIIHFNPLTKTIKNYNYVKR